MVPTTYWRASEDFRRLQFINEFLSIFICPNGTVICHEQSLLTRIHSTAFISLLFVGPNSILQTLSLFEHTHQTKCILMIMQFILLIARCSLLIQTFCYYKFGKAINKIVFLNYRKLKTKCISFEVEVQQTVNSKQQSQLAVVLPQSHQRHSHSSCTHSLFIFSLSCFFFSPAPTLSLSLAPPPFSHFLSLSAESHHRNVES